MSLFTPEEKKQIESRIQAAEKRTSGELVVSVSRVCGDYGWTHLAAAGIGWGIASAVLLVDYYTRGWAVTPLTAISWQCLGAAVAGIISFIPSVSRRFVRKRTLAAHVHHECLAHFTGLGIHETRHRTGILIFISQFERRVEILADSGIHKLAGEGYWQDQIDQIIVGIRTGRAAEALCGAIDRMADKLAAHFPPEPEGGNELSNEVRED